jgi:hypothetical protein
MPVALVGEGSSPPQSHHGFPSSKRDARCTLIFS